MKKIDLPILWVDLSEEALSKNIDLAFEDYDEDGLGCARGAFNHEDFYLRKLLECPDRDFRGYFEIGVLLPVTDVRPETLRKAIDDNVDMIFNRLQALGVRRENVTCVNPMMLNVPRFVDLYGPFDTPKGYPSPAPAP